MNIRERVTTLRPTESYDVIWFCTFFFCMNCCFFFIQSRLRFHSFYTVIMYRNWERQQKKNIEHFSIQYSVCESAKNKRKLVATFAVVKHLRFGAGFHSALRSVTLSLFWFRSLLAKTFESLSIIFMRFFSLQIQQIWLFLYGKCGLFSLSCLFLFVQWLRQQSQSLTTTLYIRFWMNLKLTTNKNPNHNQSNKKWGKKINKNFNVHT